MSNEETAGSPRIEAQPFLWNALSEDQKSAAEAILKILAEIAGRPRDDRPRATAKKAWFEFMPHIDPHRESHVLLIDGGRGSGKSAVLLTLLNAWKQHARGERLEAGLEARVKPTEMVIPVGLVDLEALPEETNLRFHLVGQLQRVVHALEESDRAPGEARHDRGAWEAPFGESPVKAAWSSFLRAATLGGADGLLQRRAHVDPEAFAVEMEETEIHRMSIQDSFRGLVDALTDNFKEQKFLPKGQLPLFLIAVDDADMKTKLSIPLLQLVRELWHPRVVFLMTGDSHLFQQLLHVETQLELRKASPEQTAFKQVKSLEDGLVDQRYRKAIPPGQRYLLRPLPITTRIQFLRTDLERIPAPKHPLNLQHLLEYIEFVKQAGEILPSNFREISDLTQWIKSPGIDEQDTDETDTKTTQRASNRKLAKWTAADFVWAMTLHSKSYAAELALRNESISGSLSAQATRLLKSRKQWRPQEGHKTIPVTDFNTNREIRLSTFKSDKLDLPIIETNTLTDTSSTSLLVMIDTVRYEHDQDDIYDVVPILPPIVQTEHHGQAYGWPFPDWRSPLDTIVFWHLFHLVLTTASERDPSTTDVAKSYLLAVLDYSELRKSRNEADNPKPLKEDLADLAKKIRPPQLSWSYLAGRVYEQATLKATSSSPIKTWACSGAGLLAAPEMGLDPTDANEWLRAIKSVFADLWDDARNDLIRARDPMRNKALLAAPKGSAEQDESATANEAKNPSYEWEKLVAENLGSDRSEACRQFFQLADSLPIRQAEPHGGPLRNSLGRYIQAARRTYLERDAPLTLIIKWIEAVEGLGSSEGASIQAVRELWSAAKDAASEMPAVPKTLTAAELIKLYREFSNEPNSWRFVRDYQELNLPPSVMVRRGSFRWADGVRLRHPLARIVFEIAWDYTLDSEDLTLRDSTQTPDPRLRWWLGGGGVIDGILCPWPAVDWWSFMDHTLLGSAWNRRVDRIERLNARLSTSTRIGDDTALWYVRTVHQAAEQRAAQEAGESRWQTSANKADWQGQIQSMLQHAPKHRDSARWLCYEEWLSRVPLLAAPESGLSPEVAEWILDSFSLGEKEKIYLRAQRFLRLTEGMEQDTSQAEETLARIDRDNNDHPWTKLFDPVD